MEREGAEFELSERKVAGVLRHEAEEVAKSDPMPNVT
jgi:hypothetical protein